MFALIWDVVEKYVIPIPADGGNCNILTFWIDQIQCYDQVFHNENTWSGVSWTLWMMEIGGAFLWNLAAVDSLQAYLWVKG